jgi:regulator of protease activity HflC (stomatin/prohibitin superfamily)
VVDTSNPSPFLRDLPRPPHSRWLLLIPLVIGLLLIAAGFKTVEAYEACLLVQNGTIQDQWGPGLHWSFPVGSGVSCYRTARITLEASPGEAGGGADYNDDAVAARSKDGQIIDAVSFRIAFSIPVEMLNEEGDVANAANLDHIYTTVGAQSEEALVLSVVSFYARPEVRAVMQLHTSEELLTGDLSEISQEIEDRLRPTYATNGVVLETFILSKPDFNDEFEQKLQQRQQAAVDVEIEQQRVLVAEQQGQARINAANADAEVAAIEAKAEAERTLTQAQAEAESLVTMANAEASAIAVQVDALGGPATYLQAQQIAAMSGWPVQFLGEGGGMPLIQVSQSTPQPDD